MIGFHGQYPINNWLEAVKILPSGTPFLSVNDVTCCEMQRALILVYVQFFARK
jgi:hypothetical protein